MTQAQHAKPPGPAAPSPAPSLGVAAATAALGNKPDETAVDKSADKPAEKTAAEKLAADKAAALAVKKARSSKIFVAVGDIHEFETAAKAEKFLNAEGAPQAYAVIRGKRINRSTKVTLR